MVYSSGWFSIAPSERPVTISVPKTGPVVTSTLEPRHGLLVPRNQAHNEQSSRPATWNSKQIEAGEQARCAEQQAEGAAGGAGQQAER